LGVDEGDLFGKTASDRGIDEIGGSVICRNRSPSIDRLPLVAAWPRLRRRPSRASSHFLFAARKRGADIGTPMIGICAARTNK
jgi:hypothetical protein